MGSGVNSNTYKVLRSTCYRDVFSRSSIGLASDDLIGSSIANAIIVDTVDRSKVIGLEGQTYIDKMVEIGYIALV